MFCHVLLRSCALGFDLLCPCQTAYTEKNKEKKNPSSLRSSVGFYHVTLLDSVSPLSLFSFSISLTVEHCLSKEEVPLVVLACILLPDPVKTSRVN